MMYMNTPTWLSHTSVDFPQSIIRFIKDCDNSVPLRGSGRIRTDESTALQAATLGRSVTEPEKVRFKESNYRGLVVRQLRLTSSGRSNLQA